MPAVVVGILGNVVGRGDDVAQDSLEWVIEVNAAGRRGLEQQTSRPSQSTDTRDVEHVVHAIEGRHQFAPFDVFAAFGQHLQESRTG